MLSKAEQQVRAPDQLAGQVQEGLLVVVVGLGADLVVLQVLLAVEGHLSRANTTQQSQPHTHAQSMEMACHWRFQGAAVMLASQLVRVCRIAARCCPAIGEALQDRIILFGIAPASA